MTTEYKLNQLIEWTDEDRAKGKCPVPDGSDVTVWFVDGATDRDRAPQGWLWGEVPHNITAYLIHSIPREPIVRWYVMSEVGETWGVFKDKDKADRFAGDWVGLVVKMVEEME
jgi:hypothetical protein